jgi:hypothetical protein
MSAVGSAIQNLDRIKVKKLLQSDEQIIGSSVLIQGSDTSYFTDLYLSTITTVTDGYELCVTKRNLHL